MIEYLAKNFSNFAFLQDFQFSLSDNQLGDLAIYNLSLALSELQLLKNLYLDLQKNNIGDAGARDLGSALSFLKLETLLLSLSSNQLGYLGAK